MKNTKQILCISLLLILAVFCTNAVAEPKPSLSLFGFNGERQIAQVASDPLLLHIMVGNRYAVSLAQKNEQNQRLLDRLESPDIARSISKMELKAMKQAHAIQELPRFTLGSATTPIHSLLNFQVIDASGQKVNLSPRLLATFNEQINFGNLDAEDRFYYVFVIESGELGAIANGHYSVAVGIDTRQQTSMWQGLAYSNTLDVHLVGSHPDPNWNESESQASLYAYYLINDKSFELAEMHAQQWSRKLPKSVDAFSYLGDALAGLNKIVPALEAYYAAAANFALKYGEYPVEPPRRLLERIDELERLAQ